MTSRTQATDVPRLRGWIHLVAFVASVVAGTALVGVTIVAGRDNAAWTTALYALGLSALFGVSALYHRGPWTSLGIRAWMRRLDHATIFVFIACTYTPFAVLAVPADTAVPLLAVVWAGALLGVALELARPVGRRWLRVPLYLLLGWAVVPAVGDVTAVLGPVPIVLLAIGGVLYTAGAILYAAQWPNPWPRTFGHHEFFHAATVIAAACHAVAVWLVAVG